MSGNSELRALINLLDDPDEEVYNHVKVKLLSMGHNVIPMLETVWEMGDPFQQTVQTRIENIIHEIQFEQVKNSLKTWRFENSDDLLAGTILIAQYQYPDLNVEKIQQKIQQICQDVWLELNDNLTALERIKIINHIIFDVHGFSGNTTNYHAPQNSYINNVVESKKGNPLSLAVLYSVIAQKLDIPIYGVNLPEHFVLCYKANNEFLELLSKTDNDYGVLFYINPFSRGVVFNKKEIDLFIKQLHVDARPEYYAPCDNVEIIKRMLRNLISSYDKLGYIRKKEELQELYDSIDD